MIPQTDNQRYLPLWVRENILIRFNFFSKDPISKNALILVSTWCMNAAVGFIFILIAAKMYSIDAVGIGMLLIAYANIVVLFTRFGIEQSMIRYYTEKEKSAIYCSTVLATTIPAICVGIVLSVISYLGLLGEDVLSMYAFAFTIAVLLLSVNEVSGFMFLANGKPLLYFVQNIVIATRLVFLVLLVQFGTLGIFSSLVIAMGLAVLFSLLVIRHSGVKIMLSGKKFLTESFHFSLGNYFSDFLQTAPIYLIPIMIFSLFGEEETAIYSVGYAIASIAFFIPAAIGYASFISGCRDDPKINPVKKMILPALILLAAIVLFFFFLGNSIIQILGQEYSGSAELVVIIMSASIFALFFQIFSAEFKIHHEIKKLIFLNASFFVALMVISFIFMSNFGFLGAGYAWLVAYALCVIPLGIGMYLKKDNQPKKEGP